MAVDGRRIAILGAGQIGEALLTGLLSSGWRTASELSASTRREERAEESARFNLARIEEYVAKYAR